MFGHLHPSEIDGLARVIGEDQFELEQLIYKAADPLTLIMGDGSSAARNRAVLYFRARRLDREAEKYATEYLRRPWARYYATSGGVIHTQENGHEHAETWRTQLTDDSGKSPEAMHREWGSMLCEECFPQFERPLWSGAREIVGYRLYTRHWARAADLRVSSLNNGQGLVLSNGFSLTSLLAAHSYLIEGLEGYCEAQRLRPGDMDSQTVTWAKDALTAATAIGAAANTRADIIVRETKKVVLKELNVKYASTSEMVPA